jgi:hypothetical protein
MACRMTCDAQADGHHIYDHDLRTLGRAAPIAAAPDGSDSDSDDEGFKQAPGEVEVQIEFQIPNELPSTDGKYIDCAYRIDILAEIDWAPDIEIQFPLNIFMPPVMWQEVVPDAADYAPYAEACVVEPLPFADGTVIPIVAAAAVVDEGRPPAAVQGP